MDTSDTILSVYGQMQPKNVNIDLIREKYVFISFVLHIFAYFAHFLHQVGVLIFHLYWFVELHF